MKTNLEWILENDKIILQQKDPRRGWLKVPGSEDVAISLCGFEDVDMVEIAYPQKSKFLLNREEGNCIEQGKTTLG